MARKTTALVVPELSGKFEMREVYLDDIRPDEVLVEIHASGLCHTDLSSASGVLPCEPNAVLGHEGTYCPPTSLCFKVRSKAHVPTICRRGCRSRYRVRHDARPTRRQGSALLLTLRDVRALYLGPSSLLPLLQRPQLWRSPPGRNALHVHVTP